MSGDLDGGFLMRAPGIKALACPISQQRCKHLRIACVEAMAHDGESIERGAIGAGFELGLVAPYLADSLSQVEIKLTSTDVGFEVNDLLGETIDLVRLEILPWKKMLRDPQEAEGV